MRCFTGNIDGCASLCGLAEESRCLAARPARGYTPGDRRSCLSSRSSAPGDEPITYTSALLAVLVGIVHAGLAPVVVVSGVKPNLVLVAVVLVTTTFGFQAGIMWAFIAGLTANLLIPEPLGSIPLALLAVAVLVAAGDRLLGRLPWVYPILAALVGSVLADAVSLASLALVAGGSLQLGVPSELIVPAAVLNATIAGLLLVPLRLMMRRYGPEQKPAW
jgi:rod shape-determining protein MreD